MFNSIMKGEVSFPEDHDEDISADCKSFIKQLLSKDQNKRLGAEGGYLDVMAHAFYKDIDWNKL